MKCTLCQKEIILIPSAAERAKKYGGSPQDYIRLFTQHAQCALDQRSKQTSELMARMVCST